MPPRKGHKKSRTGCFQCRRRKVKCEEQKPRCASCTIRRVPCTYPVNLPVFSDLESSPHLSSTSFHSRKTSHDSSPDSPQLPEPRSIPITKDVDINTLHLELMHHFSTSTCFTLSNNTEIREIWRTSIPRIGFKRPYVLQALLTLSALHIARYRPEKRSFYEAYAAREIESALRKASGLISNITEENCSAVLTFSLLATLNSLATPRKESNLLLVGKNGITEWLYTFRGMGQIVHGSWQGILKGELEPLIRASKSCLENGTSAPPETAALEGLKTTLEESTSPIANIEAVDQLLISFSIIHNRSRSSCEAPSVMVWPCSVSNAFINLLSEREPWSLVVLAYFCVLLKKAEGFWWMEGWPVHVLGHIYQLLDPLYRLNIRWPMECIGWVPPS